MKSCSSRRVWLLFPIFAAALAAAPLFAAERAIAADLTGSGRDAIVLRAADGDGAIMFLPAPDGEFSLQLYPAMGPDLQSLSLVDANADGLADVIVSRPDGLGVWFGAAGGDFVPEPELPSMHHGAHPVAAADAEVKTTRLDRELLRSLATRADVPSTSGALAPLPNDVDLARLPAGFKPRLSVAGHFLDSGRVDLALVGEGPRPRLVILESGADLTPREITIPFTTFNVNVGQGGFAFNPSSVTIQVNDTVHWVWVATGHNVVSGAPCTNDNLFCSPSNTNCSANPTSSSGATYDHTFPAAGTFNYFCRPHCGLGMTGSVTVQAAASPGAVPEASLARPGTPLKVDKGVAGALNLSWGTSCGAGANNYAVYEGSLPLPYNHVIKNCNLGNVTTTSITPGQNNAYYLVVPETAATEGSYGLSTSGEIPQAGSPCHPQLIGCP